MSTNKSIIDDIDKITLWLDERNTEINRGKTNVSEKDMPVLARVICGGEDEINNLPNDNKKTYQKFFKDNKKAIAGLTLACTGTSLGTIASGIGAVGTLATLGTGLGGATLGLTLVPGLSIAGLGGLALLPVFWPVGISCLALGATSIFARKKRSKENSERLEKLEKIFTESQTNSKKCIEKINQNNAEIKKIISEKLQKSVDVLNDASKKILIHIDDAVHSDVNSRIMQYNEIVLQQYNNQNEIRKMFQELSEAYNKLVAENEKLASQVAAYEANMKMCGCTNNYIS